MRLDNFISSIGVIKRRTVAKQMADGGHIKVNDRKAKPSYRTKIGDVIEVTGKLYIKIQVKKIPESGSVPKDSRSDYFEVFE